MKTVNVVVSLQEWDTMLAALRLWQKSLEVDDGEGAVVIDTDTYRAITELAQEHSDTLMQPKAIDELCERINCSPDHEDPVIVMEGGVIQDVFFPIPDEEAKTPCKSIVYSLIDYDVLKEGDMSPQDYINMWGSFSPALKNYYREHCFEEFCKYFKEHVKE